ncbi:LysE family translocator [Crenobacter cavernae]|uniref:LysE family translocator n=1 Tax=Crenobacter cavernae TaxID=2290923 RepID=A0A345Y4P3_9NEIS|nr:LysE family translocator [Crenobacter cavernae]AXK38895.1 LysE family translocator [Crenobacter cavernae]
MPLDTWLLFVVTVFFVSAAPGPNMLLAMTHGIRYGVRSTTPTMLGLLSALGIVMAGSVAGLGALLATSETLFAAVKYAGAAYLVWLGVKTWRARPETLTAPAEAAIGTTAWAKFRTGFLVAMSNPKAFIFFTALFPQFMDARAAQLPQLMTLAATFYVIESGWQFVYASGGARLGSWLESPARQRWVNRFAGGAFVGAGVALSGVSRHG